MDIMSRSSEQGLPPLLALPVELICKIISHLPHDEFPSRACLRRTHSAFLKLIPKANIRSQFSPADLAGQLLRTELDYADLLPRDHYPCYFCLRVVPRAAFCLSDYGHRQCEDCLTLKRITSNRWTPVACVIWIGWILKELPLPPARPQLREPEGEIFKFILSDHLEKLQL